MKKKKNKEKVYYIALNNSGSYDETGMCYFAYGKKQLEKLLEEYLEDNTLNENNELAIFELSPLKVKINKRFSIENRINIRKV